MQSLLKHGILLAKIDIHTEKDCTMSSNIKTVLAVTFLMLGLFTGTNYMVDNEGENLLMWVIFFFLGALLFWLWIMREERSAEEAVEESLDAAEETLQRLEAQAVPGESPAAAKASAPSAEAPKAVAKVPVPEPKAVAKAPTPEPEALVESSSEPDDLTEVDGVGPKSAEILLAAGIDTFAKLAAMREDEIVETIKNGGGRKSASMSTWAKQAKSLAKK